MMGSRRRGWRRRVALCGDDALIVVLILHGLGVLGVRKAALFFFLVLAEYPSLSTGSLRYILSIQLHPSKNHYLSSPGTSRNPR